MKGAPLTKAHVMEQLGRLLKVFKRPAHASDDLVAFAADYAEVCADISSEQFARGVSEYLRTDARFFPKPGELRAFALKQPGLQDGAERGSLAAWLRAGCADPSGKLLPCPICNRAWQWSSRLAVIHNHVEHRRAGEPCIGKCDEPRCLGAGLYHGTPVRESEGAVWEPPSAILLAAGPGLEDERVAIQEEAPL